MQYSILTLFPEAFEKPLDYSILKRAQEKEAINFQIYNLRNWAIDQRGTVDDRPCGGGSGMVLRPEPIFDAVEEIKDICEEIPHVVLLTPQGQRLTQAKAMKLSNHKHLLLICGHYEGVDERVREKVVDEEISIGDYILTGGELAALVVIDVTARLLPNVLGNKQALNEESFNLQDQAGNLLIEYPQYTLPRKYQGLAVPEVLLSGDHQAISDWRHQQSLKMTKEKRPDLIKNN